MRYQSHRLTGTNPRLRIDECELAIKVTVDPVVLEMFVQLRLLWLGLARERIRLSEPSFANECAVIDRAHIRLFRLVRPALEPIEGGQSDLYVHQHDGLSLQF